ncbi:hypothetical protein EVAR_31067_1 [Eumeta japonica]|uniref:Retinol dehydrogenase 11 n=1 Tax=Eumeta variegata TaxID=151549 RepID=A0A4C1XHH3_EUMVA|nr:hypothetical protein EVAR_31067_1 [Eumeta japonica]
MPARHELSECETDVRLDGKVAIVTGATSGTGLETAKNLARRGAKIIITGRNKIKTENAKKQVIEDSKNDNVISRTLDLASLSSVRSFVNETLYSEERLDVLINNAGAIGLNDTLTADQLHVMMQVNYFGSFLLTFLLYPLLKASAPSRVVNVSSLALILGVIDFERMNAVGEWSSFGIYCNAKLADVLFTVEMNKRIAGSGVNVYSMDPGLGKSDFFRNFPDGIVKILLKNGLYKFGRPLKIVSKMPVFLATDSRVSNSSGKHFRDCKEFYSTWFKDDDRLTKRLWDVSKTLVKITDDENWELNSGVF